MRILLLSVLAVAIIGVMVPSALGVTSEECSQTVTTSGNSNPDCLDPSKREKKKSDMTKIGDFTYQEKSNYYGYSGIYKFLDWVMIPATDGNYKILVIRGEITTNIDSLKKGEGLGTSPENNFAIYNYGERSHLNYYGNNFNFDWKSDFTTPQEFVLIAEMYPETHYTNPLQLYYSPVFYGTVVKSKNIQLDNLEDLPYLELCNDVSKAKICGFGISLKDIRIEQGNQNDLLILEFNRDVSDTRLITESGTRYNSNSHHIYPFSCPFGIPVNPFEIPQKCNTGGETKIKNPDWEFREECLTSDDRKLCYPIEKNDNSFSVFSPLESYSIHEYADILKIDTDRESIKKSITKPSSQSSSTPTTSNIKKLDITNLKTYENDEFKFSLKIPQSWEYEQREKSVVFTEEGKDSFILVTHLSNAPVDNPSLSFAKNVILPKYINNIKLIFENPTILSSTVVEDDEKFLYFIGFRFDETVSGITKEHASMQYHVQRFDGNEWMIVFDMNLEDFLENSDAYIEILKTFKSTIPEVTIPEVTIPEVTIPEVTIPEVTIPEVTNLKINSDKEYYVVGDKVRIEGVAMNDVSSVSFKIIDPEGNLVKMFQSQVEQGNLFDASFQIEKQFFPLAGGYDIIAWQSSASEDMDVITIKIGIKNMDNLKKLGVPAWIKNNAGWWADGQINDDSFVQGIQFMIKENIISIPNLPESSSETAESVPAWIKNNAGWWAEGQIDDNSFVKGIEYLVKVGIIQVS